MVVIKYKSIQPLEKVEPNLQPFLKVDFLKVEYLDQP